MSKTHSVIKAASTSNTPVPNTSEKGQVGIAGLGNFIQDLKKTELQMGKRLCTFDQMCEDAAVANSIDIRSFLATVGLSEGKVQSTGTPASDIAANFLNHCIRNMEYGTWLEAMRNANTDIKYGFSLLNIVMKKATEGKYKGSMVLKKLAPRDQKTVYGWVWDDNFREVQGFVQKPNLKKDRATQAIGLFNAAIPATNVNNGYLSGYNSYPYFRNKEFLIFSYNSTNNNPQGNPALASVFTSYIEKKIVEQYELTGVSKDLGGIVVARSPSELFEKAGDTDDPDYSNALAAKTEFERDLGDLHNSKTSFLHLQSDRDTSGNYLYDFELKGVSGGGKQYQTSEIIREKTKAIYNAFGTQAILIGQDGTGSNALSKDQNTTFKYYVERDMTEKADVINHQLLPRILAANGIYLDYEDMPTFTPLNPFKLSHDEAGKFGQRMKSVGLMTPAIMKWVAEDLGAPIEGIEDLDYTDKGDSRSGESNGTSGTGDTQSGGSASESNMENGASADKSLEVSKSNDEIRVGGEVINSDELDGKGFYK